MDHHQNRDSSSQPKRAAGTRRSLLWSLVVPTCVAVAVLVAAIGAYTPRAVVEAATDDAIMVAVQKAKH